MFGDYEESITLKSDILGMRCDEHLSSMAQYQIGYIYGNKLFDVDKAQAEYQKGVDNYSSGLHYVEMCEEKLTFYNRDRDAEEAYKAGDFARSAALRVEVARNGHSDIALAAKNFYQAGYTYHIRLGDNDKARVCYEQVVTKYFSGSPYVQKAKDKLDSL